MPAGRGAGLARNLDDVFIYRDFVHLRLNRLLRFWIERITIGLGRFLRLWFRNRLWWARWRWVNAPHLRRARGFLNGWRRRCGRGRRRWCGGLCCSRLWRATTVTPTLCRNQRDDRQHVRLINRLLGEESRPDDQCREQQQMHCSCADEAFLLQAAHWFFVGSVRSENRVRPLR